MFSSETSTASKEHPTSDKAFVSAQEAYGWKGVALAPHVITSSLALALCCLGGFQAPAGASPKKPGLNSKLCLLWAESGPRDSLQTLPPLLPTVPLHTFHRPGTCRDFTWICFPVISGELLCQTLQYRFTLLTSEMEFDREHLSWLAG